MSAIDNLKTLLVGKISDNKSKLSVYVNDQNVTELNSIRLFYNGTSSWVSVTQTNAPYYSNGVQVAVRHENYDRARSCAYKTLEYINANRKTMSGYYWIPQNVPLYAGIDSIGGHVFTFDINTKGGA